MGISKIYSHGCIAFWKGKQPNGVCVCSCEIFVRVRSLDDFGDVEIKF